MERIALKDDSIISRLQGKMYLIKALSARHIVNMAKIHNTETVHFNHKMHTGIQSDLP